MKKILALILLMIGSNYLKGQNKTFTFLGEFQNDTTIKKWADSLKKPLLISGNKIYVIGSSCISRLIGGDVNDRDDDGDINDRDKDGGINERKKNGSVDDRKRKGDANDRDKDGDANDRDKDGKIGDGPRCEIGKNGKIILYTRQKINSNKSLIYYKGNYYTSKSFKIKKL